MTAKAVALATFEDELPRKPYDVCTAKIRSRKKGTKTDLSMLYAQNEPHHQTKQSAYFATCQARNIQKVAETMLGLHRTHKGSGIHATLDEIEATFDLSQKI